MNINGGSVASLGPYVFTLNAGDSTTWPLDTGPNPTVGPGEYTIGGGVKVRKNSVGNWSPESFWGDGIVIEEEEGEGDPPE